MAKKELFKLDVTIPKSFNAQLNLLREWPERLKKIEPMLAYLGADYLKRFVKSKLPKGKAHGAYRDSLEVVRVRGTRPGEFAYALQVDTRKRSVRNIKVKKVLLYVHPARSAATPSKSVLILEAHNPWTYDTLPFTPDPREGIVVTRNANPRDVFLTATLRNRQRPRWQRELQKVGVKNIRKDTRLKLPKSVSTLPDVALDAVKMEFGVGNERPRPAWRLGFSNLARQGFKAFMKDKRVFAFPLTRPSFTLWKKWPQKTAHTISIAQAKKYKAFQRKVALRS